MKIQQFRSPVVVNPKYIDEFEQRLVLSSNWSFCLDPSAAGLRDKWFLNPDMFNSKIVVPGCWQAQGYGNDGNDCVYAFRYSTRTLAATYHGTGWYAKTFEIPPEWHKRQIWIFFGGASPTAEVWLNGELLGSNHCPYIPFGFNITNYLNTGGENFLVVRVSEDDRPMAHAYNWLGYWSGLYRDVELVATGEYYCERFVVHTDPEKGELNLNLLLNGYATLSNLRLELSVWEDATEKQVLQQNTSLPDAGDSGSAHLTFRIDDFNAWEPDNPFLYRIRYRLIADGTVQDAGIRRVGFVQFDMRGKQFCINGKPYYMRGSGDFHDLPETASPDTDRMAWRRRLQALRDYGYNYVRCQSFVPVPEYMDAADEVGLIVQSEPTILGGWGGPTTHHVPAWPRPSAEWYLRFREQWLKSVQRDVNHPSAAIYCMSNELTDTPYPKIAWQCYHETKAIKPNCLVIWTDGGAKLDGSLPQDFINHDGGVSQNTEIPVIEHEYKWWSSFPDHRLNERFTARRNFPAEMAREALAAHDIGHIADDAVKYSQRLQFDEAKTKMERSRRNNIEMAGICHFNAMDTIPSPQGILDAFYERKFASAQRWCQTNGDCVLLSDLDVDNRVFSCAENFVVNLYISDFSHPALKQPRIEWEISAGDFHEQGSVEEYSHTPFRTSFIASVSVVLPELFTAQKALLSVRASDGNRSCSNSWDFWIYPTTSVLIDGVKTQYWGMVDWLSGIPSPVFTERDLDTTKVLITDRLTEKSSRYAQNGGNLILAAGEGMIKDFAKPPWPDINESIYFITAPAAYPTFEDRQHCSIINRHPALDKVPHDSYCSFQFYRMIAGSPPLELEPLGLNDADPIIRMVHHFRVSRSLGYLTERRIGKGRILITALNLDWNYPEAAYFLNSLCLYLCGMPLEEVPELTEKTERILIKTGALADEYGQ